MSVEINNESGAEVDEVTLVRLCTHVLAELGVDPLAELSVVLLDADAMAALHQQWMDLPGPTDVMAFPMDGADTAASPAERVDPSAPGPTDDGGAEAVLGDVVLCPEVAAQQATAAGHSTESELHLLCTHGILHLLGYDHGDDGTEAEMFRIQAQLLASWVDASGREPINAPRAGTAAEVRDPAGGRPRS